jgi:hypothetical protein
MPQRPDDPAAVRKAILADLGRTGVPDTQEIDRELRRRGIDPAVAERGLRNGFHPRVVAWALTPATTPEPDDDEPVTLEVETGKSARLTMRDLTAELYRRGWVQLKSYIGRAETRWMPREMAERLVALGGGHIVEPRR